MSDVVVLTAVALLPIQLAHIDWTMSRSSD